MLALNQNVAAAFGDARRELRNIVHFRVGVRRYLTVIDYTQAGSASISIDLNSTLSTRTEGTHFTAGVSNAETARRIAEAFADMGAGFNAYAEDNVVTFVGPYDATTFTLSVAAPLAWDELRAGFLDGVVSMVDGDDVLFGYPNSVAYVSPKATELDVVTRETKTTGEIQLQITDDGFFRHLMVEFPDLTGKIVEVRKGAVGVPESDFLPDGLYQIGQPLASEGVITLKCSDANDILKRAKVNVDILGRNDLEAIEIILQAAGVPSDLYDAGSLDPTSYTDIGHYVVSRHRLFGNPSYNNWGNTGIDPAEAEPVKALDLVNGLLVRLNGSLLPNENGQLAFVRYDPTAGAVMDFDQVRDLEPVESLDLEANHVIVLGPREISDQRQALYETQDRNAQQRFAQAGGVAKRKSVTIESDWFRGIGRLDGALAAATGGGGSFSVSFTQTNGMAGSRSSAPPLPDPPTYPSNTTLSSTRLAYLLLFNQDGTGSEEIVSCDAAAFDTAFGADFMGTGTAQGWAVLDYTIASRGLFGTTAQDWSGSNVLVYDITPAVDIGDRTLERLSNGIPIYEFNTDHTFFAAQVHDKITLPHSLFLDHGRDGSTSSDLFEIVRKEVEGNRINWRVAGAEQLAFRPLTPVVTIPQLPTPIPPIFANQFSLQLRAPGGVVGSEYVDCGSVASLDGATTVTWSGWFRSIGTLPTGGVLFSRYDSGNEQFEISVEGAELRVRLNGTFTSTTNDAPLSADTWHHGAIVFTGAALRIFVDGVQSTTSEVGSVPSSLSTGGGSNLRFGGTSGTIDGTEWGAGRLDEWAIFNTDADSAEVLDLFNGGTPGDLRRPASLPVPIHWWRFERSFSDEIGSAHGTPGGIPFFSGDRP